MAYVKQEKIMVIQVKWENMHHNDARQYDNVL